MIEGESLKFRFSRDWAVKGPYLLGIRAIVVESYESIHRYKKNTNFLQIIIIYFQSNFIFSIFSIFLNCKMR